MTTKTKEKKQIYIKLEGGQTFTNEGGGELVDLLDDLGWEYQRMTSSGRETYDKIQQLLGTLQEGEIYMEI